MSDFDFDDLHRTFLRMEEDLSLFDLTVDGVPIWERIRFRIHREILFELGIWGYEQPTREADLSTYVSKLGLWGTNLVRKNPFLASEHEVLFWGHERRKRLEDGYWWDVYCDPIHRSLELDSLHVELPYDNTHLSPARTENLRYLDLIQITGGMRRRAGLVDVDLTAEKRRRLDGVTEYIEREFGVIVDVEDVAREALSYRASTIGLYRRFLRRVDPEVVVLVVSNGKETFIEVCKERDVPVVELQHGILNEYEYAYSYPGDRTKRAFPDYLFTFGEYWHRQVELPVPDERIRPVGYPFLEDRVEEHQQVERREQVLFLSQPNIGESLARVAVEFDEDHPSDVVFKIHPHEYGHWRSDYPWLVSSDVEIVGDGGRSLYRLFAESTAQVGVFSTALYEGLRFGLDTYLVDLPGVVHLSDLYETDRATLVGDAGELTSAMVEPDHEPIDAGSLFRPDPITRIDDELSMIISGSRTV